MKSEMHSRHSRLTSVVVGAAVLVAVAVPVSAHHSFSAEFSRDLPVSLEGEVLKMEWVNPHSWLHINVTQDDGTVETWQVEGGSPSVLMRAGWTRDSLPVGTKIKVEGFGAKDGSLRAQSRGIEFPDGSVLNLGGTTSPD
jgi:hypothetical protein